MENDDQVLKEKLRTEEYLRLIQQQEDSRHSLLSDRGRLYFTFLAAFMTIGALNILNVTHIADPAKELWLVAAVIAGLAFLFASLACVIISFNIRTYEDLNNPQSVLQRCVASGWDADRLVDARLADLVVSTARNKTCNDRQANWLRAASYLLLPGLISLLISATLLIPREIWSLS